MVYYTSLLLFVSCNFATGPGRRLLATNVQQCTSDAQCPDDYICVGNIGGNYHCVQAVAPISVSYSWAATGFGACDVTCGEGTRSQTVTCTEDGTSQVVEDSFCSGVKPETQQACNESDCPTPEDRSYRLTITKIHGPHGTACSTEVSCFDASGARLVGTYVSATSCYQCPGGVCDNGCDRAFGNAFAAINGISDNADHREWWCSYEESFDRQTYTGSESIMFTLPERPASCSLDRTHTGNWTPKDWTFAEQQSDGSWLELARITGAENRQRQPFSICDESDCPLSVRGAYFSVTGTASDFQENGWNLDGVASLATNWGPKQDGAHLDYSGSTVSGSYFECCYPASLAYVTLSCSEDPCTGKMTYMYWSGGYNGMFVKILPAGSSESVMRESNDENRVPTRRVNEWTTVEFQWNDGDIFSMYEEYGHGFQILELFTAVEDSSGRRSLTTAGKSQREIGGLQQQL